METWPVNMGTLPNPHQKVVQVLGSFIAILPDSIVRPKRVSEATKTLDVTLTALRAVVSMSFKSSRKQQSRRRTSVVRQPVEQAARQKDDDAIRNAGEETPECLEDARALASKLTGRLQAATLVCFSRVGSTTVRSIVL